jgi:hypothetical protein
MRQRPQSYLAILFALTGLLCMPAQAAIYCVDSEASIQAALNAAAINGELTNIVQVVGGNYALSAGLIYDSSTSSTLGLRGSEKPGCLSVAQPQRSVLDGQHVHRPLLIAAPNAVVDIRDFDFVGGLSTANRGGGLSVYAIDIRVDLSRFIGNRADDFAGGLFAYATGDLRVRNNLLVANSAATDGGVELYSMGTTAYVNSNTVIANTTDAATAAGGLRLGGTAHFSLSNNILWSNNTNGGADLIASNANGHDRLNNDIGTSGGAAQSASSAGNLSVNPGFAACGGPVCFSFQLSRSSPLVDAGIDAAPGLLATLDLLQGPRIVGEAIDIGAYEEDVLFANGFQ